MNTIDYFKLQAKNLFRDYKTKKPVFDGAIDDYLYEYDPKYFDIDSIICDFDINEDNFSLMKAQHVIAYMAGFRKWTDLNKASKAELELGKLLFDNQDKIDIEDWEMYILGTEHDNNISFDAEARIEILKQAFVNVEGHENPFGDYRLNLNKHQQTKEISTRPIPKTKPDVQIISLPLNKTDRAEFIEVANSVFETVMCRMEPRNPEITRKLWDARDYVDNALLTKDMLPISKSYALSLIDAFLVHHVLGLATQADKMAAHA
ncbi:MAG: hypothetical protein ACTHOO_02930 [Alcanivorax sp.]